MHEARKAYQKEYRKRNRDKLLARHREYWAENREYLLGMQRARYAADPEKRRLAEKQLRATHGDKIRERDRLRSVAHPERRLWGNCKHRAKVGGGVCEITAPWLRALLLATTHCRYCGERMVRHTKHAPSVDKVIPELWYVVGNVDIICMRCNAVKNSVTSSIGRAVIRRMAEVERGLNRASAAAPQVQSELPFLNQDAGWSQSPQTYSVWVNIVRQWAVDNNDGMDVVPTSDAERVALIDLAQRDYVLQRTPTSWRLTKFGIRKASALADATKGF